MRIAGLVSGCWTTVSTEITAVSVATFDPVRLHFLFESDVSVGNVLVHSCMNTRFRCSLSQHCQASSYRANRNSTRNCFESNIFFTTFKFF